MNDVTTVGFSSRLKYLDLIAIYIYIYMCTKYL